MTDAIAATRQWLERLVIGLDLCPFAAPSYQGGRIDYAVCAGHSLDEIYQAFALSLERLLRPPHSFDTTLLIVTDALAAFEDYLDTLALLEEAIESAGLSGLVQIASFHPDYRFADASADDPANHSNRSPYPMFHLIREDLLEQALANYPDPEGVPERNIARLRALGVSGIRALIDA